MNNTTGALPPLQPGVSVYRSNGDQQILINNGTCNGQNGQWKLYRYSSGMMKWNEARARCEATTVGDLGGSAETTTMGFLGTDRTMAEHEALKQILQSGAWLGGNDIETEGVWKWVSDGSVWWRHGTLEGGQEMFAPDTGRFSNNDNDEDALCMWPNGVWNDIYVTTGRHYVCEYCLTCPSGFELSTRSDEFECVLPTSEPTSEPTLTPTSEPTEPTSNVTPPTPVINPVPPTIDEPTPMIVSTAVPPTDVPLIDEPGAPTPEPTEVLLAAAAGFNYLWLLLLIPCCLLLLAGLLVARRRKQTPSSQMKHKDFHATRRGAGAQKASDLTNLMAFQDDAPLLEDEAPVRESRIGGQSQHRIDML